MFHVVLVEPEIPPNTGNIARTCGATGSHLHLIRPLGFSVDDRSLKRAGLDYWHFLDSRLADGKSRDGDALARYGYLYDSVDELFAKYPQGRFWYATTKGGQRYDRVDYRPGDFLVFGPETRGLPETMLREHPERCVRIPMLPGIRSLNLSNSVAVLLYEALRQRDFEGFRTRGLLAEEENTAENSRI